MKSCAGEISRRVFFRRIHMPIIIFFCFFFCKYSKVMFVKFVLLFAQAFVKNYMRLSHRILFSIFYFIFICFQQ